MNALKSLQTTLKSLLTKPHLAATFFIYVALASITKMPAATAQALGDFSLHMATDRTEDSAGGSSSERHFRLNLATGWSSNISDDQKIGYGISFRTERGLQSGSELSGYGFGVFVGWYDGPFSLRLDYIALSELKSNTGVIETAFKDGSGISIQARWLHWIGTGEERRYGFGPSLAFEQIKYAKSRVGSLPETSASRTTEALMPGLAGVFLF